MAGFFLSTDPDAVETAERHFAALGHAHARHRFGAFTGTIARKLLVPGATNVAKLPDGILAAVGAYATESAFGAEALGSIAAEVRAGRGISNVAGHLAVLVDIGGECALFTDHSGHLPVYRLVDGAGTHYSTSLLALAGVAERLSFGEQEILEFLSVEATFGRGTAFREITGVPYGARVSLADDKAAAEPVTSLVEQTCSFDEVVDQLRDHFTRLRAAAAGDPRNIGCDLSAGLDGRTVAALLHANDVPHVLNTNVNRADLEDHRVALAAAAALGRPITLHAFPESAEADEIDIDDVVVGLEGSRDAVRSRRMLHSIAQKAEVHPLLLGGYGGELLRDKYSLGGDVAALARSHDNANLSLSASQRSAFLARLEEKFRATLAYVGGETDERASEKIYYFEKMRTWGGTRIAAQNRHGYGYHPLLDLRIQRLALGYPLAEKRKAALQHRLIALDPALARQPYAVTKSRPPTLAPLMARARRRFTRGAPLAPEIVREQEALGADVAEFARTTGVSPDVCGSALGTGRYLTLVRLFRRYREKISAAR